MFSNQKAVIITTQYLHIIKRDTLKFDKKQKISLRTPTAKPALYFHKMPRHTGKFGIMVGRIRTRGVLLDVGDLVRISHNQRYVQDDISNLIQITSISALPPIDRRYMGNQYVVSKESVKIVPTIPPGTIIRLMSKDYPAPVGDTFSVIKHEKGIVTVEYKKKIISINDSDIEGVPSEEFGTHTDEDRPIGVPRHGYYQEGEYPLDEYPMDDE